MSDQQAGWQPTNIMVLQLGYWYVGNFVYPLSL